MVPPLMAVRRPSQRYRSRDRTAASAASSSSSRPARTPVRAGETGMVGVIYPRRDAANTAVSDI